MSRIAPLMILTTLGMMKTLYRLTISSLKLQKILTAMGVSVMKNLDPPFRQVALLHLLIPPIVTPFFVFFMMQLKLLENAWVLMKVNRRQFHRHNRHCHQCRLAHPKPKPLASALVTRTLTGTTWHVQHLRPELIQMESVHTVSYRYTTRRTWKVHYRQCMYQTRNGEVVVQPWQEGVDVVRNSWYPMNVFIILNILLQWIPVISRLYCLSYTVNKPFRDRKDCDPFKLWGLYEGPAVFFVSSVLCLPCPVRKPFRFHNSGNSSKRMEKLWGLLVFLVPSLWYCLVRYTSLLGFAIQAIPQNGWKSYEAY